MPRRVAAPARLRRRLAVSFVVVAGLSAGVLAAGSFLLVRQTRLDDAVERALHQARLNLEFAQENLAGRPTRRDAESLLSFYSTGGFGTVLFTGHRVNASTVPLRGFRPPPDLDALVADGQVGYERLHVDGDPSLVVGERVASAHTDLYFVFSERSLDRDLRELGFVLAGGWLAVLAVAAVAGAVLARRTLEPVARASEAARSMAEGLLDTRLPVQTDDEFGLWAASFNEMAAALEAKIEALSEARERERRFTSDVSHELRTPLSALVTEASLLREHIDSMPEEARRPAQLLVADVARLRRLVEELMEISRLDSGREPVVREPVEVEALVRAVVAARDWDGAVAVTGGRLTLSSDRRRLERIVSNLVGNALEHGDGHAWVHVRAEDADVVVEVADRGPGIPPEHLPHLFERFYKADPSRAGPGSGLGLAIARENAGLLGGGIEVESVRGVGTRFVLRIPVAGSLPPGEGRVAPAAEDGTREEGRERS
ncbi:MAG: ATP-binding protein [Actinomycetota bacterium]